MGLIPDRTLAELHGILKEGLESVETFNHNPTITVFREGVQLAELTDYGVISLQMANQQEQAPLLNQGFGERELRAVLRTWFEEDPARRLHVDDRFKFQGQWFVIAAAPVSPIHAYTDYNCFMLQGNPS